MRSNAARGIWNVLLTSACHGSALIFSCWCNLICGFSNQVHWNKWLSLFHNIGWSKGNLVWLVTAGQNGDSWLVYVKHHLPLHRTSTQQYPEPCAPMTKLGIIGEVGWEGANTEFLGLSSLPTALGFQTSHWEKWQQLERLSDIYFYDLFIHIYT